MFFPRREAPLELAAERLHGLRLSLNAPVISTGELPPGPARAAIAVHEEADGTPNVTVGVRSLRSGELVLYSYDGDLREESSVAVGTDAALSFAEGMGFLFDDDELSDPDPVARVRALGLWNELIDADPALLGGDAGLSTAAAPPEPNDGALDLEDAVELDELLDEGAPGSGPELVLDDALEEEPDREPAPAPPPSPPRARPAPEPLRLSKFRMAPPASGSAGRASRPAPARPPARPAPAPAAPASRSAAAGLRKAALGRLKLIKRRKGGESAEGERPNWILKLLSSF